MDFGLREVLILVGFLMIVGIILDGYRRMRKSKLGELDLSAEMGGNDEDEWGVYTGELPNGGARKVGLKGEAGQKQPQSAPVQESLRHRQDDFDVDINDGFGSALEPDDMDVGIEAQTAASAIGQAQRKQAKPRDTVIRREAVAVATEDADDFPVDDLQREYQKIIPSPQQQQQSKHEFTDSDADLFNDDELLMAARQEQQAQLQKRTKRADSGRQAATDQPEAEIDPNLQEVLVVNVMAKQGGLPGMDLLKVMQSCGFQYGEMNIFHRYEQHSGKGGLLFSVANVVEPGVFDLDKMETFSTPGICLFMKLPGPKRAIHGFDVLMDSARRIASLLDADIKDEHHNVMRQQTVEHYRQRVLEFERKFMSYRAGLKQR